MESEKVLVKLYVLNEESSWDDRCTGYLFFYELESQEKVQISYKLAIAEDIEGNHNIQEFDLNPNIRYNHQQDTLISWEESGQEYAISFQSAANCQVTYETIQNSINIMVKGAEYSGENNCAQTSEFTNSKLEGIENFQEFTYNNLAEISLIFAESMNDVSRRDQLAAVVEKYEAIPKILELFRKCEELEDIQGLSNIYIIIKSMFSFTKFSIFETLLNDDNLMEVIGILEYNPALSQRINHRKIVESCKLVEVVPLSNKTLKDLIIHTHRLQYLQDVILPAPAIFEERGAYLTSFVFFRKNEIMEFVFDDKFFLLKLFSLLSDEQAEEATRKNLLKFIVEICNFSRILQPEQKEIFMSKLLDYEVMASLQKIKEIPGEDTKSAIIDILFRLADTHPDVVRHGLLSSNETKTDFIVYICDQIIEHPETPASLLAVQVIKCLFDISNTTMKEHDQKIANNPFISCFYSGPINFLMGPIYSYTSQTPLIENSYIKALALENVLDILLVCISFHTYHIKNYLFKNDTLKQVVKLLSSKHAFIAHSAIRVLRRSLASPDEFYSRYLSRELIIDKVVDALKTKYTRYDMVNSAIIELFEFIRVSNNRALCVELVEHNRQYFESVSYVPTFKKLLNFVDQYLSERESKTRAPFLVKPSSFFISIGKNSDANDSEDTHENSWIEDDSNETETLVSTLSPTTESDVSSIGQENGEPILPPVKPKFKLFEEDVTLRPVIKNSAITISLKRSSSQISAKSTNSQSSQNVPLVDYPDDEDIDEILPPCDDYTIDDIDNPDPPTNKKSKFVEIT